MCLRDTRAPHSTEKTREVGFGGRGVGWLGAREREKKLSQHCLLPSPPLPQFSFHAAESLPLRTTNELNTTLHTQQNRRLRSWKSWSIIGVTLNKVLSIHAKAFLKVCVSVFLENASIDSRPPYRFDAFSTVHTKTFENDRTARCDRSWTLGPCYKQTRLRFFGHCFHFDAFFERPLWYDM